MRETHSGACGIVAGGLLWFAARALAMLTSLAWPMGFSEALAEPDRTSEVKRVLALAPDAGRDEAKDLRVVLLADAKDHGPAGNGKHDYPLWQKRWAPIFGGAVTMAEGWPSDDQFRTADVIVAYCYLKWTDERLDQVRRYLEGGGGLVLIHSATWTKPEPSREVAEVVGVGGFRLFRHGSVHLDVAAREHPICLGLPPSIVMESDETYWPPTPMMENVTVLATATEEEGSRGKTPRAAQPMFWCHGLGGGRVFGCVPGHSIETFDDPFFRILLLRGIAWAAGGSAYRFDGWVLGGEGRAAGSGPDQAREVDER